MASHAGRSHRGVGRLRRRRRPRAGGEPEAAGHPFHLTSACDATSIGELLALACDKLDIKAPPLIAPALYLRVLVPLLGRLQPRRRTFLRAAATYVPYFAVRAQFDDTRARAALGP